MDPALKESKLWAETLDDSSDEEEEENLPPQKSWFSIFSSSGNQKITPGTEPASGVKGDNSQKEESMLSGPLFWLLLLLFLLLVCYLAWYAYQYFYGKENEETGADGDGKDLQEESNGAKPVNGKVPETNFQVSNTGSVVARVVR